MRGCLAVLARLTELGCQIVVATHSPLLLALAGATIYEIAETGQIDQRVKHPIRVAVQRNREIG